MSALFYVANDPVIKVIHKKPPKKISRRILAAAVKVILQIKSKNLCKPPYLKNVPENKYSLSQKNNTRGGVFF